jgi:Protein of unknown function (DUF3313)
MQKIRLPTLGILSVLLAFASFGFSGCAANQLTRSGQLSDYTQLQRTADEDVQLFVAPGFDAKGLRAALVDEPRISPGSERLSALSEAQRQELLAHLRSEIQARLDRLPVDPGSSPLRIRSAITDVDTPNRVMNVATTLLLTPVTTGGSTLEIEVIDERSGQAVMAMVCAKKGSVASWSGFTSAYSLLGHAKNALSDCIASFDAAFAKRR